MAETYYAARLANDEGERREGTGSEPLFQSIAAQLSAAGIEYQTPFAVDVTPEVGLSDREVLKRAGTLEYELARISHTANCSVMGTGGYGPGNEEPWRRKRGR